MTPRLRWMLLAVALAACGGGDGPGSEDPPADVLGAALSGAPLDASLETSPATSPGAAARDPADPAPGEAAAPADEASEEDAHPITFRELSLAGADVNGLLDLVFAPGVSEATWEFPEAIQALDGRRISIVGYMIALDYDGDRVTRFMLVRDLASCCFGGIPRPDEWIDVTLATPCEYFVYVPVRATGKLSVGLDRHEDGLVASVFQLTGATARLERMR